MSELCWIESVKQTVFWKRCGGVCKQRLDIHVRNDGETFFGSIAVQAPGWCESSQDHVEQGSSVLCVYIPKVTCHVDVQIHLLFDTGHITMQSVLKPGRQWEVYMVPITHHDLGYTEPIESLMDTYNGYFDRIMEICRSTAHYPWEAQYRYTVEVLWAWDHFMKHRPPHVREEMMQLVRDGKVELSALYAHVIDVQCSHEELIRALYPSFAIQREYGVPITTASVVDIPGMSWGLIKTLANAGVKHLFAGFPSYFEWWDGSIQGRKSVHGFWDEGKILRNGKPDAFNWEAQDGSKVLTYYQGSYGFFRGPLTGDILAPERLEEVMEHLPPALEALEAQGVPFSVMRYIDHGVDNYPPRPGISDIVMHWNAMYEYPKLVVGTQSMFFERIAADCGDIRTFRGELPHTDYNVATASAACETGRNLVAQSLALSAEKLSVIASCMLDRAYPAAEMKGIYRDLIMFDEHCYGLQRPFGSLSDWNWNSKRQFALRASAKANQLLADQADRLAAAAMSSGEDRQVVVFNPMAYPRTDVVKVCNVPWNTDGTMLQDSVTGEFVPVQSVLIHDPRLPVPYAAHRYVMGEIHGSYGKYAREMHFIARDVPAMGYKTYTVRDRQDKQDSSDETDEVFENRYYRFTLNTAVNGISSLYDKELGMELVDRTAPHSLFQWVVRGVRDQQEEAARSGKIIRVSRGPIFQSILWETSCPGCSSVVQEVILYASMKRIDFTCRVAKDATPLQEMYAAFPFHVEHPCFRYEGNHGVVQPFLDQLPGSNTNYYSVRNWASVSNDHVSITLSPRDAKILEFGGIHPCYVSQAHHGIHAPDFGDSFVQAHEITKGHIYSFPVYTNFRTNFSPSQVGDFLLRYSVTSGLPGATPTRFGWDVNNPFIPAVADPVADHFITHTYVPSRPCERQLAASASFCEVVSDHVFLLTLKKAEADGDLVMRFMETEGFGGEFYVKLPLIFIDKAERTNVVEMEGVSLPHEEHGLHLSIQPYGLMTVKVTLKEPMQEGALSDISQLFPNERFYE